MQPSTASTEPGPHALASVPTHDVAGAEHRARLLATLPVEEKRLELGGIDTAVLEGGDGPPLVLLHGPGESSLWWMRVVGDLAEQHRVIAPDLPGHGASTLPGDGALDEARVLDWLGALIEETCAEPPVLVGHLVGGSIAARFAADHGDRVHRLVLVDALGLRFFLPSLRFAWGLVRFVSDPTEARYDRFLDQCMLDQGSLRAGMGETWEPFLAYNLACARREATQEAMGALMKALGLPRIAPARLEAIDVPTGLIWGRHDKATPVKVAERARDRYGWPLEVVEGAGDDPKMERPREFLAALSRVLEATRQEVA